MRASPKLTRWTSVIAPHDYHDKTVPYLRRQTAVHHKGKHHKMCPCRHHQRLRNPNRNRKPEKSMYEVCSDHLLQKTLHMVSYIYQRIFLKTSVIAISLARLINAISGKIYPAIRSVPTHTHTPHRNFFIYIFESHLPTIST